MDDGDRRVFIGGFFCWVEKALGFVDWVMDGVGCGLSFQKFEIIALTDEMLAQH